MFHTISKTKIKELLTIIYQNHIINSYVNFIFDYEQFDFVSYMYSLQLSLILFCFFMRPSVNSSKLLFYTVSSNFSPVTVLMPSRKTWNLDLIPNQICPTRQPYWFCLTSLVVALLLCQSDFNILHTIV